MDDMDKIFSWVSIHASVKDATLTAVEGSGATGFNPRICKRCDLLFAKYTNCP